LFFQCGCGVHIANSTDVTFEGFTIDYRTPCFAQGKVVTAPDDSSSAMQNVVVAFDTDHFLDPKAVVSMVKLGMIKATFWDPSTLRIIAHGNHIFTNMTRLGSGASSSSGGVDISTIRVGGVGDSVSSHTGSTVEYKVAYTGKVVPAGAVQDGSLATLHPRLGIANGTGIAGGLTYLITNSTRVASIGVVVHGGATEAVVEGGGAGNHTYTGIRVARRHLDNSKSDGTTPVRLLAANADGFHSSCVRIGPQLVDSEFAFTGDDHLNIHSRISIVMRPLTATSAYIIDAEGSSSPADYDDSTLMLEQTIPTEDSVAFFALGTLAPLGSAVVTAARRVHDAALEVSYGVVQPNFPSARLWCRPLYHPTQ
jgi:hypothetical protein